MVISKKYDLIWMRFLEEIRIGIRKKKMEKIYP